MKERTSVLLMIKKIIEKDGINKDIAPANNNQKD